MNKHKDLQDCLKNTDKQMSVEEEQQYIDKIWRWAFHEDNLLNSRIQGFLTTNTLLLAVAGFLFKDISSSKYPLTIIIILGFVLSLILFLVQYKIVNISNALGQLLYEKDPLFKEVVSQRNFTKFIWPKLAIPVIIIFLWIVFCGYIYWPELEELLENTLKFFILFNDYSS
jgi:hypothetical protein